jgi:hypothetical protein
MFNDLAGDAVATTSEVGGDRKPECAARLDTATVSAWE